MKLLVAIASYGHKNDVYLARVLSEYRRMAFEMDIIVLSNVPKDLGRDVQTLVGLPSRDPWSLPFAHKAIFAERQHAYDLFLYSEDDMLVRERNITAFLDASRVLSDNEVAGLFQWEHYADGRKFFPAVHSHFHWVPGSAKRVGNYTFARFTNDHSACYLLTRAQLQNAIKAGGFDVGPHEWDYDLLVTAATDPYTQCGLTRLLCVSHLEDFLVQHLPNRYIGTRMGLDEAYFYPQLQALMDECHTDAEESLLGRSDTSVFRKYWSKCYYESCRANVTTAFPAGTRNVLSIGCGWGATEEHFIKNGFQVTGLVLDPIIGACAQTRGVEVISGDLVTAFGKLNGRTFDGVLLDGIVHLVPNAGELIRYACSALSRAGIVVATVPNVWRLPFLAQRLRYPSRYRGIGNYVESGMNVISRHTFRRLCDECGLKVLQIHDLPPGRCRGAVAVAAALAPRLVSDEYIVVAQKRRVAGPK